MTGFSGGVCAACHSEIKGQRRSKVVDLRLTEEDVVLLTRLLVLGAAALAASASASYAGSCSNDIDRMQARIDARVEAIAAAGPFVPAGISAGIGVQPTPFGMATVEEKMGEISRARPRRHQGRDDAGAGRQHRRQRQDLREGADGCAPPDGALGRRPRPRDATDNSRDLQQGGKDHDRPSSAVRNARRRRHAFHSGSG